MTSAKLFSSACFDGEFLYNGVHSVGISVAIIKPVGNGCNLQCKYCYVEGKPAKVEHMTVELGKKIVDELFEQQDETEVEFLWHGGEPLLQPLSFYSEIFAYQAKRAKETGKKYVNAIQTNLTLIDDTWLDFFQENKITISTSIDGPAAQHNSNRVFPNGEGAFSQVCKGIALAQKRGAKINALCVVSKENVNIPEEICKKFDELSIFHVGFLPCYKTEAGVVVAPSLSPGEYGVFLCKVFDLYLQGKTNIKVREMEQFLGGIIENQQDICSFTGHCSKFVCIDSAGDVFACDTAPQDDMHRFGNLTTHSLNDLLGSAKYCSFINQLTNEQQNCAMCSYYKYCHNGCSNMRVDGKYYYCEDRKILFSYFEKMIKEIIRKEVAE